MSRTNEVEQACRRGASMRGSIADAATLAAEVERLKAKCCTVELLKNLHKKAEARVKELERHLRKEADGNRELMKVVAGLETQNARQREALERVRHPIMQRSHGFRSSAATLDSVGHAAEAAKLNEWAIELAGWHQRICEALNGEEASK